MSVPLLPTYSLDLGFNRYLKPNPANGDRALLTQGFTRPGVRGNPVFTSRQFKLKQTVVITLYDLSPIAASAKSQICGMNFSLKFIAAATDQLSCKPIDGEANQTRFKIFPGFNKQESTVFEEKRYPVWLIELSPDSPDGPQSEENQLQKEKKHAGSTVFTWEHPGYYYYTMRLDVWYEGEQEPKKFRLDPEMIITGEGEPPDDEGGDG